MAIRTTSKWLTACLFYGEPWEEFLIKAVKPYIDVVRQTGVAERCFFQRSWDRGPHIRLWFKGNEYILENMLKPNLQEHFTQYYESRPSLTVEPNYPNTFPESYKWYPNNSVQFEDYEPELDRFGGTLELSLFEKQYEASSNIVLSIIKDKASLWTYNEMVGTAIKLHLSFAYSVGMSMGEACDFFQLLSRKWGARNAKEMEKLNNRTDSAPDLATIRSFQKIFEIQYKDIVPYHAALWELFKNYRKMDDPGMVNWFHVNTNLGLELNLALDSGKLRQRPNTLPGHIYHSTEQQALWNYFEEFISLTNNRLGIHNKNEGYLYYVMGQSLQAVTTNFNSFARVSA